MSSSEILASHRHLGASVPVSQLFTRKELVGKGAYGGVYKGIHNATGLVVALKVIDLDTPDDDISEIQKEVALLSEMRDANKHNITLYHGCYLQGYELWIAMDFASGGSIRTLMKSGSIEEKYIVLILREVLVALSFLHRQAIIHRDVKAANILLTQAGKILLCDFGVAAHLQTNNKRSTFIGTPLWMAPEVITDGKMYDTKADIWSLGVTLYEIATGNPPYFGMEPMRACAIIPRTAPAKLEGGTWSAMMREFLAFCLQIDPTTRPTADELSRTKWIKSGAKVPMSLLRELIVRYVSWIQTGGQRASLAGLDSIAREDTFEIEEDKWDFDGEEEEMIEPLGDEPPRSLDAQAAISQIRPPKAPLVARNHPLLRLFDEESNPYAQPTAPTTINLPSGSSLDTVRPTISIPSFDEMDDMFASSAPVKFGGASAADELMSPAGSSPFSWANQPSSLPFAPSAPRFGANVSEEDSDGPWDNTTPTESTFPTNLVPPPNSSAVSYPVTASPSLPTVALDRQLESTTRRRADTAPSFDYPPLGPGIPSSSSGSTSTFTGRSTSTSGHSATTSISSVSASVSSNADSSLSSLTTASPRSAPKSPQRSRAGTTAGTPTGELRRGFVFGGIGRARGTSDARGNGGTQGAPNASFNSMLQSNGHGRSESGSRSVESSGYPRPRLLSTSSMVDSPFDFPTPLATTNINGMHEFPFPSLEDDETEGAAGGGVETEQALDVDDEDDPDDLYDEEEEVDVDLGSDEIWAFEGLELKPLDYLKLRSQGEIKQGLEETLAGLGEWLKIVEVGLERILGDQNEQPVGDWGRTLQQQQQDEEHV
ncbi:STE/STE20/YSK protein kinase [Microbotryum lychnidis-dioicae p1A1 Lamole]|uniref:non-specific serine/threonine protein kinase n=1 Tax=Microbotryum lychnidis-dioicae (strain p1A1 Lamole / MvSl-1064) TaxID=683840 RepID=U5HCI9_USTV1|nr:STE/STE20/YSK protein kinase [Microbotryum lychnidis-dioicae p1A1 Lamole]|eukprot:KDE04731.1 STE/STE20/YSK protein kinase [Microbotryum lychnidis-dioicae p1A1 Lamole]